MRVFFLKNWRIIGVAILASLIASGLRGFESIGVAEALVHHAESRYFPVLREPEIAVILYHPENYKMLGLKGRDSVLTRNFQAEMYAGLDLVRPKAVAFDFLFFGNAEAASITQDTQRFRQALEKGNTSVTIPLLFDPATESQDDVALSYDFEVPQVVPPQYASTDHIRTCSAAALEDEMDLRIRSVPLIVKDRSHSPPRPVPSLALSLFCLSRGIDPSFGIQYSEDLRTLEIGDRTYHLDPAALHRIRFADQQDPIPVFDYAETILLLREAIRSDKGARAQARTQFKDKTILIGTVVGDEKETDLGKMPGTTINAYALNSLMAADRDQSSIEDSRTNAIWIVICATLAAVAGTMRPWPRCVLMLLGIGLLIAVVPLIAFYSKSPWLETVSPTIAVVIAFMLTTAVESFRGYSLPRVPNAPEEATVMFIDIRGSTSLVNTKGVSVVTELISRVYKTLSHEVESFGGEVERSTGDGLMVLFRNTPFQNGAVSCMEAVAPVTREIQEISKWFQDKHGMPVSVGMGIESGVIATVLVEGRGKEPSSVGEAVNLAARLQEAARDRSLSVLVGPSAYELTKHRFVFESIGEVEAKGLGPTQAYVLVGSRDFRRV